MTAVPLASSTSGFADGNGGHLVTLPSAPGVGELDVLCINSNTVITSVASSGGAAWTQRRAEVSNQGAYIYERKATGGEPATVTITTSGNHNTSVGWSRYSNTAAFDTAAGTQANASVGGSTPAHNSGALAEAGELLVAFGALHSIGTANQSAPVWSSGYTALTGPAPQGSSTSGVNQFVGYRTDAGPSAETPQVSWSGDGAFNRYMLTAAWKSNADVTGPLAGTLPLATAQVEGTVAASQAGAHATGGWYGMVDIIATARADEAAQRAAKPVACPHDGEPLRAGPHGELFCPFDGWTWRG